jgi:aspartate aminotransferase
MPVATAIYKSMTNASWIRKMFEEGIELKKKFGEENVFDFTIGNPDLDPPEKFYEVLKKHAGDRTPFAHGYMPNGGYDSVREMMALRASRDQDIDVSFRNIVMTVGAAGALNVVFKSILNPGEEVIVPSPYFTEYGGYAANHQGVLVTVDTNNDFSLNVENIRKAITDKTSAVLINSPNNPTGKVYSKEELVELTDLLKERLENGQHIYLIADEPYREIVYDGLTVPPVLPLYSETFVVSSFSKSLSLPGERIGYIIQHPQMKDCDDIMGALFVCNRVLGFVNAPGLMQKTVAEILDERVDVDIYRRRRDLLVEAVSAAGLSFAKPEGAFYLFVKSPVEDELVFLEKLAKYNILAVPGFGFGGKGYIRLAYCVSEDIIKRSKEFFIKAVGEL